MAKKIKFQESPEAIRFSLSIRKKDSRGLPIYPHALDLKIEALYHNQVINSIIIPEESMKVNINDVYNKLVKNYRGIPYKGDVL